MRTKHTEVSILISHGWFITKPKARHIFSALLRSSIIIYFHFSLTPPKNFTKEIYREFYFCCCVYKYTIDWLHTFWKHINEWFLSEMETQSEGCLPSDQSYLGGMLDLAQNDCALSFWLAKTVLKEADVIQIWFSHVPWTDESAHADEENMMKNIQQYLFMSFQIGVFRMTMIRQIS